MTHGVTVFRKVHVVYGGVAIPKVEFVGVLEQKPKRKVNGHESNVLPTQGSSGNKIGVRRDTIINKGELGGFNLRLYERNVKRVGSRNICGMNPGKTRGRCQSWKKDKVRDEQWRPN